MKKLLSTLALILLVSLGIFVVITATQCLFLHTYASYTEMKNDVVDSAGKVDWLSLSAVRYSQYQIGQNNYEHINIHRMFGDNSGYSYANGVLYGIQLNNNYVDNPKFLAEHLQEAKELLVKTRERFSDIMPPQ